MRKIAKNNYQDHQKKNSACTDMVEMCFVDDRRKQKSKMRYVPSLRLGRSKNIVDWRRATCRSFSADLTIHAMFLSHGRQTGADFLLNLSSHYHICIVKYPFTCRDDQLWRDHCPGMQNVHLCFSSVVQKHVLKHRGIK